MITRRGMFSMFGLIGVATSAPLLTGGVAMLDPGRSVTYLPGGGMLIEDETFRSGIMLKNCSDVTVQNCIIDVHSSKHAAIEFET